MSTTRRWTEAELMAQPDGKHELVGGEIVRLGPAGWRHGIVEKNLIHEMELHVRKRDLGWVVPGDAGSWMPSGNLRVPDVSFIARERFPDGPPAGFSPIVPDVAAEILSPSDSAAYVLAKIAEYLGAGVRLVWVLDPESRTATVHRPGHEPRPLGEDDALDGFDVVPGFRCALAALWA